MYLGAQLKQDGIQVSKRNLLKTLGFIAILSPKFMKQCM